MIKQFGDGDEPWTEKEFLFNAMIWTTGTRMWGTSKELTTFMRKPHTDSDVIWNTVELFVKGTQFVIWSREDDTSLLDLNPESDTDDLYREGDVTKQFWINSYEWIEQWRNESH